MEKDKNKRTKKVKSTQEVVEIMKDNEFLMEFYKKVNDNTLHIETLCFTSKMLMMNDFSMSDRVKVYLKKYNSLLCISCSNDAWTVVSLLNNMAYNAVNDDFKIDFPQYKSELLLNAGKTHSKLPLHDIKKLLEGILYNEKSKEEYNNSSCFDMRNDYDNLLEYFKNRLDYINSLIGKLNTFVIITEKDKEVYNEIKEFINKFR